MNTVYALIVVLNPPAWGGQPFLSYEADYPTFAECETARDAEIKGWVDHPRITGLVRFGAECILVTSKLSESKEDLMNPDLLKALEAEYMELDKGTRGSRAREHPDVPLSSI